MLSLLFLHGLVAIYKNVLCMRLHCSILTHSAGWNYHGKQANIPSSFSSGMKQIIVLVRCWHPLQEHFYSLPFIQICNPNQPLHSYSFDLIWSTKSTIPLCWKCVKPPKYPIIRPRHTCLCQEWPKNYTIPCLLQETYLTTTQQLSWCAGRLIDNENCLKELCLRCQYAKQR